MIVPLIIKLTSVAKIIGKLELFIAPKTAKNIEVIENKIASHLANFFLFKSPKPIKKTNIETNMKIPPNNIAKDIGKLINNSLFIEISGLRIIPKPTKP